MQNKLVSICRTVMPGIACSSSLEVCQRAKAKSCSLARSFRLGFAVSLSRRVMKLKVFVAEWCCNLHSSQTEQKNTMSETLNLPGHHAKHTRAVLSGYAEGRLCSFRLNGFVKLLLSQVFWSSVVI